MKSYFEQPIKRGHTVFAYVFEGEGIFGDFDEESSKRGLLYLQLNMVIFGDGDYIKVKTDQNPVRFLLISGKPLNEPIARYGPFVMNTSEEIEQALIDLRTDNFVK